jgi:hypothetical protein
MHVAIISGQWLRALSLLKFLVYYLAWSLQKIAYVEDKPQVKPKTHGQK